jgi:hypothetical protein
MHIKMTGDVCHTAVDLPLSPSLFFRSLSLTRTLALSLPLAQRRTHSLSLPPSLTLSPSLSHSLSLSLPPSPSLPPSLTHSHSLSLSQHTSMHRAARTVVPATPSVSMSAHRLGPRPERHAWCCPQHASHTPKQSPAISPGRVHTRTPQRTGRVPGAGPGTRHPGRLFAVTVCGDCLRRMPRTQAHRHQPPRTGRETARPARRGPADVQREARAQLQAQRRLPGGRGGGGGRVRRAGDPRRAGAGVPGAGRSGHVCVCVCVCLCVCVCVLYDPGGCAPEYLALDERVRACVQARVCLIAV